MYNNEIMNRFVKPKFAGAVKGASGIGTAQSVTTNEIIKISLKIDENEVITDAKFKAFGGAVIIATADVACEIVEGLSLREAEELHETQIMDKLIDIANDRLYAPVLAINAISDAINDYYKKKRRHEKQKLREQGMSNEEIRAYFEKFDSEQEAKEQAQESGYYDDYDYNETTDEDFDKDDVEDDEDFENEDSAKEHLSGSAILSKYFGINK